MRIVIITLGTRGDVQPYIALGQGLKQRGHIVTICTSSSFEKLINNSGLNYGYINNGLIDFIHSEQGRDLIENTTGFLKMLKVGVRSAKKLAPLQQSILRDSWESTRHANPDLILFHPKALGAIHFAQKLGISAILTLLQPVYVPTTVFPSAAFKPRNVNGWYNKLTYQLILGLSALGTRKLINRWRQSNQLPKAHKSKNQLQDTSGRAIPVLHGFSRHVIPDPEDWPNTAHITGYWFVKQKQWQATDELEEFINAGTAPIYVGFGSMAGKTPGRLAKVIIEALRLANVRAIMATGWGGLELEKLPCSILKITHAPHEWLFPKMAAVIHHGGAGTTAAGLRAGCPTIICPFIADQPFWGWQVHKLGVGSEPIPQQRLTPENLAQAIRLVIGSSDIKNNAQLLAEKIRNEDGITSAIDLIEGYSRKM